MSTATIRRSVMNASVLRARGQEEKDEFLIEEQSPEDYAAQWGDTTADGSYFYNFRCNDRHSILWLRRFHNAIVRLRREIAEYPERYDVDDRQNLGILRAYVLGMIEERQYYKVA